MRLLGLTMCSALYAILTVHVFAYFHVVTKLLHHRLGVEFALIWVSIGLTLLYNIIYNHFFAMMIRPGSPSDLIETEIMRAEIK